MSTSPINAGNPTLPASYDVESGDTLSELAEQNELSLNELLKLNPQFATDKIDGQLDAQRAGQSGWDPDFIRPGDTIILRKSADSADPVNASGASTNGSGNVVPASFNGSDTDVGNPTTKSGKVREAMRYFQSQGWSEAQAAGIVANLVEESGLSRTANGDGGLAYGIAQWHPDRQAKFEAFTGRSIQGSTFADQLKFVQWELMNDEKAAGQALRGASSASEAAAIFCRLYERPADIAGESRSRGTLAQQIVGNSAAVYV